MNHFHRWIIACFGIAATAQGFASPPVQKGIENILPEDGPKVRGPYSPGVLVDLSKGKLLFVSGHLPIDPKSGAMVDTGIEEATYQALQNIHTVLKASGITFDQVVRVDVFLRDMKDFAGMNQVYAKFFNNGHYPARQTTQSNIAPLVEISCIALVPSESQ